MGDKTSTAQPAPREDIPENEGFLANRWRMLKAGAKSVYTYLTTPKTWLMAAAFAGVGLGLAQFAPQYNFIPIGEGLAGAAAYTAKMVTIGTLIHMGIDMFKEGRLKGYHPNGQEPQAPAQSHCQQAAIGNYQQPSQSYDPQNYRLDEEVAPPPMTPQGNVQQPSQPNIDR